MQVQLRVIYSSGVTWSWSLPAPRTLQVLGRGQFNGPAKTEGETTEGERGEVERQREESERGETKRGP